MESREIRFKDYREMIAKESECEINDVSESKLSNEEDNSLEENFDLSSEIDELLQAHYKYSAKLKMEEESRRHKEEKKLKIQSKIKRILRICLIALILVLIVACLTALLITIFVKIGGGNI